MYISLYLLTKLILIYLFSSAKIIFSARLNENNMEKSLLLKKRESWLCLSNYHRTKYKDTEYVTAFQQFASNSSTVQPITVKDVTVQPITFKEVTVQPITVKDVTVQAITSQGRDCATNHSQGRDCATNHSQGRVHKDILIGRIKCAIRNQTRIFCLKNYKYSYFSDLIYVDGGWNIKSFGFCLVFISLLRKWNCS